MTKAVQDIKAGKIEYRLDKTNIIHVPLGKASFTEEQLADNFQTLIDAINKAKPAAVKGPVSYTHLECATKNFYVFGMERKGKHPVRILDKKGFIKVQRNDAKAVLCKAGSYRNIVSQLWEELAIYQQDAILRPDYYICAGARVMDFAGSIDLDKIMMLMEVEMQMRCV